MKTLWWYIGIACRTFIVLFAVLVVGFLIFPFFEGVFRKDLENVTGQQAKPYLGSDWREYIPETSAEQISLKIVSEINYSVKWLKVSVDPTIAER